MNIFKLLFALIFVVISSYVSGQSQTEKKVAGLLIKFNMGYNQPSGYFAELFTPGMVADFGISYKLKSNYFFGVKADLLFSHNVKKSVTGKDLFGEIVNSRGEITNSQGLDASVNPSGIGFDVKLYAGKIFPVIGPNPNSGIFLALNGGFIQHKLRIYLPDRDVPQLMGEYAKGYDRLSNGAAVSGFFGYMHLDSKWHINFYGGVEITQTFVKNRRSWNVVSRGPDNELHMDRFYMFKAGFIIPLYSDSAEEYQTH